MRKRENINITSVEYKSLFSSGLYRRQRILTPSGKTSSQTLALAIHCRYGFSPFPKEFVGLFCYFSNLFFHPDLSRRKGCRIRFLAVNITAYCVKTARYIVHSFALLPCLRLYSLATNCSAPKRDLLYSQGPLDLSFGVCANLSCGFSVEDFHPFRKNFLADFSSRHSLPIWIFTIPQRICWFILLL